MSVGTFAFIAFIVCFVVCYNILHDYNIKKLQEEKERKLYERRKKESGLHNQKQPMKSMKLSKNKKKLNAKSFLGVHLARMAWNEIYVETDFDCYFDFEKFICE